jgi:hypothetical protein
MRIEAKRISLKEEKDNSEGKRKKTRKPEPS